MSEKKDKEEVTMILCKLDRSTCEHEWKHADGRNDDVCVKCGQGFLAYIHMECP